MSQHAMPGSEAMAGSIGAEYSPTQPVSCAVWSSSWRNRCRLGGRSATIAILTSYEAFLVEQDAIDKFGRLWDRLDEDGDGGVSAIELVQGIISSELFATEDTIEAHSAANEEAMGMMDDLDLNQDGDITREEWITAWRASSGGCLAASLEIVCLPYIWGRDLWMISS